MFCTHILAAGIITNANTTGEVFAVIAALAVLVISAVVAVFVPGSIILQC